MGYDAYTVDMDFTVPADQVPAALHAVNAAIKDLDPATDYTSLATAVDEHAGFADSDDPGDDEVCDRFRLGYYASGHYNDDYVLPVLTALAPFAAEGSYVRFLGEDDSLFGFRVVAGKLVEETGDFTWSCPRTDTPTNEDRRARGAQLVAAYIDDRPGYHDVGDAVCDLLTDLRHYCATVSGLEFDALNTRAAAHYQAEAPKCGPVNDLFSLQNDETGWPFEDDRS